MSIKVSVIVPNYNHELFLKQRIESILDQTYKDFELIILDDCSLDKSKEIIECYNGNSKVSHIIYNKINSGSTFKQWQKGIELAKGDYIWIAESDDWCEPSFLEQLIKGIDNETTISYCQSIMLNKDRILWYSSNDLFEQRVNGKEFVSKKMLTENSIFNASMCIFRKDVFYKISSDFIYYRFCGDWLFWIELALQGNVFISGRVLNYFRKHDKDVSSIAYSDGTAYFEFFDFLDSLEKKKIIDSYKKETLRKAKFKEFLYDSRLNKNIFKKVKKEFLQYYTISYFIELTKWSFKKIFLSRH